MSKMKEVPIDERVALGSMIANEAAKKGVLIRTLASVRHALSKDWLDLKYVTEMHRNCVRMIDGVLDVVERNYDTDD